MSICSPLGTALALRLRIYNPWARGYNGKRNKRYEEKLYYYEYSLGSLAQRIH